MTHSVLHPHLYTPATTAPSKLQQIIRGMELNIKRLVICMEDSVREADMPMALDNLRSVLTMDKADMAADVFVRPRNYRVLQELLDMEGIDKLEGFVVPKASVDGFPDWMKLIQERNSDFRVMPILEEPRMTDPHYRMALRQVLSDSRWRRSIDCLRIGGNDLMGHQGIRRDDDEYTIYDTVIGTLISNIINEFRGSDGFIITAPVFEAFGPEYDHLFRREVRRSVLNELFGQTVIHPRHIGLLARYYAPDEKDVGSARSMLSSDVAVNGRDGKMDESATHAKWAKQILEREKLFSIR